MTALRRLVRTLRLSASAIERDIGVSGAQLFVLRQLQQRPAASLNELAERTLTHQSSVSTVVRRLAERGLVARSPAADDARRLEIALTAQGAALARRAPRTAQEELVQGLRGMSAAQVSVVADALESWLRAAGLDTTEPALFFEDAPRGSHGRS